MFAEYKEVKEKVCAALENVADKLESRVSIYALLDTEDPAFPYELRLVHKAGEASLDANLINQRLFDNAFLEFGFREVRSEDNLEGIVYKPLEDLLVDSDCIGVAPVEYFDADRARVRMAAGVEEDPDEDDEYDPRFVSYLNLVQGRVLAGGVADRLTYEDVVNVRGLVFSYLCGAEQGEQHLVAFQRVQPMWVNKKSSFMLFGREGDTGFFADRSLKLGTGFDFIQLDGMLCFKNMRALEILFGYRKLVAQQAKDYADTLDGFLADFEKLDERISASRSVANKLLKIQKNESPVADMSPEDLEYRLQRTPYYNRKLKLNEEGKVMLTTNAEVNDFLKMLDDNYLVSPLSQAQYESRSKRRLDMPEQ